jgi:uncharacterized membrane protein YkvA (DUF1232 family)
VAATRRQLGLLAGHQPTTGRLAKKAKIPVPTSESKFVELVRNWLVALPHDIKTAYDALDDENLPRAARELAVGTIIYIVSPHDIISDRNDAIVSFVDDAMLLRLGLAKMTAVAGDDGKEFRDRYPDLFATLEADWTICREVLGDLAPWLESKVATLKTIDYKGKKIAKFLDDADSREQLFEDGLVFRTDYPVDEKSIGDRLKKASTVTDALRRAKAEETRAKGLV